MKTLWPYQREGVDFLKSRRYALLGDRMGLGKTAQAIVAADESGAKNVLVVCPASVRTNWLREFDNWSLLDRPARAVYTAKDPICRDGVTVISYDMLLRPPVYRQVMDHEWDVLILDEAHYLKSRTAQRTKRVYGPRCRGENGLAERAGRVFKLTGTPAENNYAELWTHLRAAGVYPHGYWRFVEEFCHTFDAGFGVQIRGGKNHKRLRALLDQFMLRRRLEDVAIQLPDIRFSTVTVEPSPIDWEIHFPNGFMPAAQEMWKRRVAEAEQTVQHIIRNVPAKTRMEALAAMSHESISTLRRYTGYAKLPASAELIKDDLEAGQEKIVVFAAHRDVVHGLRDALRPYNPVTYFGGTTPEKKDKALQKFTKQSKCRVFIGQIQAAGTGIDGLQQVTNRVDFVEMDWSPAKNAQAVMRVHRWGQEKPVHVRQFALADSVDEHITRLLARKLADLEKLGLD